MTPSGLPSDMRGGADGAGWSRPRHGGRRLRADALWLSLGLVVLAACGTQAHPVTFNADIGPLVRRECSGCHREGGIAPFALTTYDEVRTRGPGVRAMVESRRMPPWPADPTYRVFLGQHTLTSHEIALIGWWVESGMPEGEPRPLPPIAPPPRVQGLGEPDLVLEMPEPIRLPGDRQDHFFMAKLPFVIPADTTIRAIEFVPGNRALVHHMNGALITYSGAAKADPRHGAWYSEMREGSMEGAHSLHLENDDGTLAPITLSVANYLPGSNPVVLPDGIGGWRVTRKGVFLLNMIHYGPTATPQEDRSRVNIYFGDHPPTRPVSQFILGTLGIAPIVPPLVVPPDTVMTFRSQLEMPTAISIVNINPHMHLLGRSLLAFALTPAGDTIPLIRILHWDFRWQYFYTPPKIITVPARSVIHLEVVLDNTTANPNNPFSPPREVKEQGGSMRTTDEMIQLIISGFPYRPGDESISLEATPQSTAPGGH